MENLIKHKTKQPLQQSTQKTSYKYKNYESFHYCTVLNHFLPFFSLQLIIANFVSSMKVIGISSFVTVGSFVKSTSGTDFVVNPPGIYDLSVFFFLRNWRNACRRFLYFSDTFWLALRKRIFCMVRKPIIELSPGVMQPNASLCLSSACFFGCECLY